MVRASALEAHQCASIGAWNAVATMARRSVQAAALERGAPEGNALRQIKWLAEEGHINESLREVADRLRIGGRDGAHPEFEAIDESGAVRLLGFLDTLLTYLYEIPHSLEQIDPSD